MRISRRTPRAILPSPSSPYPPARRAPSTRAASRRAAVLAVATVVVAACSASDTAAPGTSPSTSPATAAPTTTRAPLPRAAFTVRPGTEQVAVLDAEPGTRLAVVDTRGNTVVDGTVDDQGTLLWREVPAGDGYVVRSTDAESAPFRVADPAEHPDSDWYAAQAPLPAGGFGYLTVRDGTTLSVHVVLPGPAEAGPYPTVVEYSGYQPSDPDSAALAQIYTGLGFAYVGVNMRGTGCSGGSYRFFETVQSLDGYDVIETVARQPWVRGGRVGMVGISYPGISQLFVAATQPPHLAAITPLSVLDDAFRSTLYPGGVLNTGFAVAWTAERVDEAAAGGQEWAVRRIAAGDETCAANQLLRGHNPDLVAEVLDNPYYPPELGDALAPATFVDRIAVPVFLAGAWQDEQTGGRFPAMIPAFDQATDVFVTLVNGGHTESLSPAVFGRYVEFLQLYVAEQVPTLTAASSVAPLLAATLYGDASTVAYFDRFAGMTLDEARAAFESEPAVRVLLEQGAAEGFPAGAAVPRATVTFDDWPVEQATITAWSLDGAGALVDGPAAAPGTATYSARPDALPATFFAGEGSEIWRADAAYDWRPLPEGTAAGFVTAPFLADALIVGAGSVDVFVSSDAPDTDLEVTLSEVRPDGTEVFLQSGLRRASMRALDNAASTALVPVHTDLATDAAPLRAGAVELVRVELFPVAHLLRAGSRLRLTIDAPGHSRPEWEFDTVSDGETVTIHFDPDHPSRIVLPIIARDRLGSVLIGTAPPACGALRGQPCRLYVPAANGG